MKRSNKFLLIIFVIVFYLTIIKINIIKNRRILESKLWYVSNVVKINEEKLERNSEFNSYVFEFYGNSKYRRYIMDFDQMKLINDMIYFSDETYRLTNDSLIFKGYLYGKLVNINKDSIEFLASTSYSFFSSDYKIKNRQEKLRYILKPIYANKIPNDTTKRYESPVERID